MYVIEHHYDGEYGGEVTTVGLFPDVEQANRFIAEHPDEFLEFLILYDAKHPHTVRFNGEGVRVGYALTVAEEHGFVAEDLPMKMWRSYKNRRVLYRVREVEYGRIEYEKDVVVTV